VNVNGSAQRGILQRSNFPVQSIDDPCVLRFGDQAITQTALGVFGVWVAHPEREIDSALRVLCKNIEAAFGSPAVSRANLVSDGTQSEAHPISPHELAIGKEQKLALAFLDYDTGFV
jgi:hypothetical protein